MSEIHLIHLAVFRFLGIAVHLVIQRHAKIHTNLRALTVLGISLTVFMTYDFMSAAWNAPTGAPPTNNTDAPINVGSVAQTKKGNFTVESNMIVKNLAPHLEFDDTDGDNNKWWLRSDAYGAGPTMHFLYDRNSNNGWDAGDGAPSLLVKSGVRADGGDDHLQVNGSIASNIIATWGQMRSNKYCNADGSKCATFDELLADKSVAVDANTKHYTCDPDSVSISDSSVNYKTMRVLKSGMYLLSIGVSTCGAGTCRVPGTDFSARYPVWMNSGDYFEIGLYNGKYDGVKLNGNLVNSSSKFVPETPYGTTWLLSNAPAGAKCGNGWAQSGTTSYGGNDYSESISIGLSRFTD